VAAIRPLPTRWFGLDECRLQPWGLSTPAVEEVRRLRGTVRRLGIVPAREAAAGPAPVARPVAAVQARDARADVFAALQEAVEEDRGVSALRHCLTQAEAAVHGGASAAENELLRRATDLLLRKDRGVGVSAPPPSAARRRGRPSPRELRPARTTASSGSKAADAVADLLNTLDRRRGRFLPGEQQRLVARLEDKARQAGPWLTSRTRMKITAWKNSTPRPRRHRHESQRRWCCRRPRPPPHESPRPRRGVSRKRRAVKAFRPPIQPAWTWWRMPRGTCSNTPPGSARPLSGSSCARRSRDCESSARSSSAGL
jgi:hypothetical protein